MQFKEKQSIYKQIAGYIYEQILTGIWPDNERIPSIREMAVQMEVNPNTMTRAYSLLTDEGIIYNQRGIGYFTAENASVLALKQKRQEFIENDLPELFGTLESLSMEIGDLIPLYEQFKKSKDKE